uniref:ER lumen protein-retaining receptor n=1 Tax=Equus asinus TaxID=9793 RepID=A0A9L0J8P8_EQUAS
MDDQFKPQDDDNSSGSPSMGCFQPARLIPSPGTPDPFTPAPELLAQCTEEGTEAERAQRLAKAVRGRTAGAEGRSRGPGSRGQLSEPGAPARDLAGPGWPGRRAAGRKPPGLARPPRPGTELLGRAGRRDLGRGASWLPRRRPAWPRHRPARSAREERRRPGRGAELGGAGRGARGPGPGTWQPPRPHEVPRSCLRVGSGPAGWTMNVFRILGDLSHLLAMILLLGKIWRSKCCAGISGKSQILFALVFTTRYLDLFTNFISIYNTVMKVVFLLCAYVTVYMIYGKFRKTFDSENDTFRLEFLLVPVIGLSFLENYNFTPLEILWTFSIYLESVAILPQLFMISKTGEAETITTHYLFFLGLYRALYLANWIRRYQTENFYDQIAVVSGVVQTIFYCDFFYLYVTKVLKGKKLSLPMPI